MGFLDAFLARMGYAKTQSVDNPPAWLTATAAAERYNLPDEQIVQSQADLYQRLSWVQTAVSRVAEAAAVASFQVTERKGEDTQAVVNHPFEELLRRPNPLMSRFELLVATFSWLNLTGMSYWWLNRRNANQPPAEIWQLPTSQIEPVPDGRLYLKGYLYSPGGGAPDLMLEPWEIVQFRRWHPQSWFVGLSPLESLAVIARGDLAMQRWNTNVFAENNAKIPGALAFKEHVDDGRWQQLKEDIIRQHGGTKRTLMMLRGVGEGVNWLPMAMSPADMEFLSGRNANKEEIFSAMAPGLSSMLSVNATEANAIAGRGTFVELAVWPQMVAVAEKISNDILPSYGDSLTGEFDDIRPVDRAMTLQEQAAFAQVHTVDEVRAKFYQSEPLGDERGLLLVTEVGKFGAGPAGEEAQAGQMLDGVFEVLPPAQIADTQSAPQEEDTEAAKRHERKALRRYLRNRPKAQLEDFERRHLTAAEVAHIAAHARGDAAGGDAFFRGRYP